MALRDEIEEGKAWSIEYSAWKDQVQPALNFELRQVLKRSNISEEIILGPTSFFHSTVTPIPMGDTVVYSLITGVKKLLFEEESVVVFDPKAPCVQTMDALSQSAGKDIEHQ